MIITPGRKVVCNWRRSAWKKSGGTEAPLAGCEKKARNDEDDKIHKQPARDRIKITSRVYKYCKSIKLVL